MTLRESITITAESSPEEVAKRQLEMAYKWGPHYAETGDQSAEIILRNPAVYLRDVPGYKLPKEISGKWRLLMDQCEELADEAATGPKEWSKSTGGIEKVQSLVRDGHVKEQFRGIIAQVMVDSSRLFKDSVQHFPGNTNYYAGNVRGAEGWFANIQS